MKINKDLLERYASLKTSIKELEKQAAELNPEVLAEMQKAGVDEVELEEIGTFVLVPKRKWKYPQSIVKMEEELKKEKVEAEAKGTATYDENPYVMFKEIKKE